MTTKEIAQNIIAQDMSARKEASYKMEMWKTAVNKADYESFEDYINQITDSVYKMLES